MKKMKRLQLCIFIYTKFSISITTRNIRHIELMIKPIRISIRIECTQNLLVLNTPLSKILMMPAGTTISH